jgi:hypothetical protein
MERLPIDIYQLLVIPRLKIEVGERCQSLINQRLNTIGRAQRRNYARFTVTEESIYLRLIKKQLTL